MNNNENLNILPIEPQTTTIKAKCPKCQNQIWLRTDIFIKPFIWMSLTIGYELEFILTCDNCKYTIFQYIGLVDENLNTIEQIYNQEIFITFLNLRIESKLYNKIQKLKER
jgi:predicted nucleic-acid-binding Zn-ribbon protein